MAAGQFAGPGGSWRPVRNQDGEVLAVVLQWGGDRTALPEGCDGALTASVREHAAGVEPGTPYIVSATVRPDRTGAGLAGTVLTGLRERGRYPVPGALDRPRSTGSATGARTREAASGCATSSGPQSTGSRVRSS
ncbi:hypothetical protein L6E12_01080 [Actinokineospora sp. PR83]|uniref:hypothetical protein n=1 Tax=Actinokineospora sp. PR83 TaxID=2884908 RepID=UPI001F24A103|nr:hypothetical protein [Actinokineospora sp. PR83]MCG8914389.1 hypothetical protein [Actinokineospora sp. PR83]